MLRLAPFSAPLAAALVLGLWAPASRAQTDGEWKSFGSPVQPAAAKPAPAPAPDALAPLVPATPETKPSAVQAKTNPPAETAVPAEGTAAKAPAVQAVSATATAAGKAARAPGAAGPGGAKATRAAGGAAPAPRSPARPAGPPAASKGAGTAAEPPSDWEHSPSTLGRTLAAPENWRSTAGAAGATGLLRVGSAQLGRAGIFRIALFGEFFHSSDFPVLGAKNTRTAGTLSIDYTLLEYLEAYFSYAASANTNSEASPALMQSQGDMNLGVKAATAVARGLSVGADLRLKLFPGVGGQDLGAYAFGFDPRLLATFDVRQLAPKAPVLVHLNGGMLLDSTGKLLDGYVLKPWEEYALGVHRYNRLAVGAGVEAPLPIATPFVEWTLAYPLGAPSLIGPDGEAVSVASVAPHQLTLGAKLTAVKDLTIVAAVELGLSRYVGSGIPATQPYNVVLGLSYNFNPTAKPPAPRVVEVEKVRIVEKPAPAQGLGIAPPATGKVAGSVLDAATRQPLSGVIIAMSGTGLPPVASDAQAGKYLTHDLAPGKALLTFTLPGYKTTSLEAQVEVGKIATLQAHLARDDGAPPSAPVAAAPSAAGLAVLQMGLASGKQKVAGKVALKGPKTVELRTAADGSGQVELPAGHYVATVEADGYLSKINEFDVPASGTVKVEVELTPAPKKMLVVVKDDRIEIKQQVHFANGKAVILDDSYALLDQVIDAIVRANVKKVLVEGHTDNRGAKAVNLKLSAERAQAVADYLVRRGIDRARLEAKGFGDARPIAPNLTARGRDLNRRVEFVITER